MTPENLSAEEALDRLNVMRPILERHLGEDVFVSEDVKPMPRLTTGIEVFDYILGGGLRLPRGVALGSDA